MKDAKCYLQLFKKLIYQTHLRYSDTVYILMHTLHSNTIYYNRVCVCVSTVKTRIEVQWPGLFLKEDKSWLQPYSCRT